MRRPQRKQPRKRIPADIIRFASVRAKRQKGVQEIGRAPSERLISEHRRRGPRGKIAIPIVYLDCDQPEIGGTFPDRRDLVFDPRKVVVVDRLQENAIRSRIAVFIDLHVQSGFRSTSTVISGVPHLGSNSDATRSAYHALISASLNSHGSPCVLTVIVMICSSIRSPFPV